MCAFQMLTGQEAKMTGDKPQDLFSRLQAEYLALSSATQEVMRMRKLNSDLGNQPTIVQEDNQAAISMSKDAQFHERAKHIDIRHHFI